MREMGLYDDAGTLIAVGNMAESYKPTLAEGSGRAQTVRMVIMVSDINTVELTIDTTTVMASQDYVDGKLAEHEQSRRHPDATLTAKGFTQLSNATDSASEVLAATPKAVKAAYDLANGKYTAQDATTAQKGIVQLSSATDSASESVAATPKAVKMVSDDVINLKNNLRDAAYRNVADNAAGDLVPVGYKGNFVSSCSHEAIDFATYPFVVGESLFLYVPNCANVPAFLNQPYYYMEVISATGPAQGGRVNRPLLQFISYTNPTAIFATREDDGTTISWRSFRAVQYDADNSTVTAPGSIKASGGATELANNAIYIRGYGNKHLWFHNSSGQEMGLVYASDDMTLHLRAGQGPALDIYSNGNATVRGSLGTTSDIYSGRNISNAGLIQAGSGLFDTPGVRVYSPNNLPPKVAYTQSESDSRYQPMGSYAAPNTAGWSGGFLWWRCASTGVMRQSGLTASVSNGGRVTFPTAFPNACASIVANQYSNIGSGGTAMQPYNMDSTGFNLRIAGGGTVDLVWTAEGL